MPSSIISNLHTAPLRVKGLGLEGKCVCVWGGGGGGGAKSFMKGTGRKKISRLEEFLILFLYS